MYYLLLTTEQKLKIHIQVIFDPIIDHKTIDRLKIIHNIGGTRALSIRTPGYFYHVFGDESYGFEMVSLVVETRTIPGQMIDYR